MKFNVSVLLFVGFLIMSCTSDYYGEKDFYKLKKFDAHFHFNTTRDAAVKQAEVDNFKLLTINVNTGDCNDVKTQCSQAVFQKEQNPDRVVFAATFCMDGFGTPNWLSVTEHWLDSCFQKGAIAVKVWKNIGMSYRDESGKLVMIDDSRFDPLFDWLAAKKIPVVGHLGEPKNCWIPLSKMTTMNDSSYYSQHPQYHMFLHPELPSYEAQMAARDHMLAKHPHLKFIGAHLASLEWSVDEIAAYFDKYPNAAVDMAERMGQLFYQTRTEREKVRNFFLKYQDRILYGTDMGDDGKSDPVALVQKMHQTRLNDWKYLTTDEKMTSQLIHGGFQGVKLPKAIVDKIYWGNGVKWYGIK
jgi:predicted TIM-barrel fold metal-dependent hydrolase